MTHICTNPCCQTVAMLNINESPICFICHFPMTKINSASSLWLVEKMIENIANHGAEETFNMIDKVITQPLQRCSYRKWFLKAVYTLGLEWELTKNE